MAYIRAKRLLIPRPSSLNREAEEIGLKFLSKSRGRAIFSNEKTAGRISAGLYCGKKTNQTSLHELVKNWENIVGERTAKICYPEAIRGKTFMIKANSAASQIVQMRSNEILGVVSLFLGISLKKLSIIQTNALSNAGNAKKTRLLSADERAIIEEKYSNIESPRLRNALIKLGSAIAN